MLRRKAAFNTVGVAVAAAFLAACGNCAAAELQVRWNELPKLVNGKTVKLLAPDGARLEGKVVTVEGTRLVLKVARASNPITYPRNRVVLLPRDAISSLDVQGPAIAALKAVLAGIGTGVAGATVGTALFGMDVSAHMPVGAARSQVKEGAIAVGAAAAAMGVAAGIAESRDRMKKAWVRIRVLPDPYASPTP